MHINFLYLQRWIEYFYTNMLRTQRLIRIPFDTIRNKNEPVGFLRDR